MNLTDKVEETIADENLLNQGDRIIVAVSGGPDSVALLHILFLLAPKWKWTLAAAHVNHRFRGEEADRDAEFTASFARSLGIPCETASIDVPAYIKETGLNAQDAARRKRYGFLFDTAERLGAGRIALAHHADDQAETVLMRILRGSGLAGISGMKAKRTVKKVELIRPLLRIYKAELIEHCRRHGLDYRLDSSNVLTYYTRNRIRLDLLPALLEYNPNLPSALNRLADISSAEDDYLDRQARLVYRETVEPGDRETAFSGKAFAALHLALQRRLIKLILEYLTGDTEVSDFGALERIRLAALRTTSSNLVLDIGGGVRMIREYDRIRIALSGPDIPAHYQYTVDSPDVDLAVSEAGIRLTGSVCTAEENAGVPGRRSKDYAEFDLNELRFPLCVRPRENGDRIEAMGLNGSKKVKDIFIDEKVPPSLRGRIPLVTDADGRVLWIPGFRRSVHAPVTAETRSIVRMKVSPL